MQWLVVGGGGEGHCCCSISAPAAQGGPLHVSWSPPWHLALPCASAAGWWDAGEALPPALDPTETNALTGCRSLSLLPRCVGTNHAAVAPRQENIELALADAEPGSSGSVAAVDQPSHQALVSTHPTALLRGRTTAVCSLRQWPGGFPGPLVAAG